MDFEIPETAPPIVLNIWDRDSGIIDNEDDFVGRAVIPISEAACSNNHSIPTPKWHKIRTGFGDNEPA